MPYDVYHESDGRKALLLAGIIGVVVGFFIGHRVGAHLAQGIVETAIRTTSDEVMRVARGPAVLALTIQGFVAIVCASVIPVAVVLTLKYQDRQTEVCPEQNTPRL